MTPLANGFGRYGRWFDRRMALASSCAMGALACGATHAPSGRVVAAPSASATPPAPAEAKPAKTQWDFSVMSKWHLCEPDDLDDCTVQCDRGHLPSCFRLGNLYFEGTHVPQDLKAAAELYELACTYHLAAACWNRAMIYANEHDMEHAAAYYDHACDSGAPAGCYDLAVLYDKGSGVKSDPARAAALYETACEGGDLRGCSNLGVAYMNGHGVVLDEVRAVHFFEKACDGADAVGCGNLGLSYRVGRGVARDCAHATQLSKQACEGGAKHFCEPESGNTASP